MSDRLLDNAIRSTLVTCHSELEEMLGGDVIYMYTPMSRDLPEHFRTLLENLHADSDSDEKQTRAKRPAAYILLTTKGGSAEVVEQLVNIVRHHYDRVSFVVPNYAYSAGTIFCMSGNEIHMDYSSVLGPIDPQVESSDGKFIPALGYLDQVNALIEKSRAGTLTDAEFVFLQKLDLGTLRVYEQARDLTIDLLETWLVKYKFADWTHHSNDAEVTMEEKKGRARDIGNTLNNHNKWKSHARPISIEELEAMKLRIQDYSHKPRLRSLIREYDRLVRDYMGLANRSHIVVTRNYLKD